MPHGHDPHEGSARGLHQVSTRDTRPGASSPTTPGLRLAPPTRRRDDLGQRLEQLNAIGASLSAERDINRLLETILTAAKNITRADGGTLYRVTDDRTLRFEIVRTSSLKYYLGGTTGNPVPFYPIPLLQGRQAQLHHGRRVRRAHRQDGEHRRRLHRGGLRLLAARATSTRRPATAPSRSSRVPMRNHEHEIIGVLQLINATDPRSRRDRAVLGLGPAPRRVARLAGGDRAHQPHADQPARGAVRVVHQPHQHRDRREVALHRRPLPARAAAHHDARRGGERHARTARSRTSA